MDQFKKVLVSICIVALALLIIFNRYTNEFIQATKKQTQTVSKEKDRLLMEIEQAAKKYYIPAENAKVDRVWYAMPGYNGLQVDIQSSYKQMKKSQQFDEKKLVFKQIKPDVVLQDLPAEPIYRGHPEKPMVSFLINVAWGNEYLPKILQTLESHQVYATFFLEGRWAKSNPEMAQMIVEYGHEIGNHSYSHPQMENLSKQAQLDEMKQTNDVIEAITEKKVEWFGPPSGGYNDETVKTALELNMRTVMWTVDTIDWQKPSANVLIQRVMSKVHPGAMILMHPTEPTAEAMDELITQLKQKQLRIGTVSKLLSEERINLTQNFKE